MLYVNCRVTLKWILEDLGVEMWFRIKTSSMAGGLL